MLYQLCYDKSEASIKIQPLASHWKTSDKIMTKIQALKPTEMWRYNDWYYFANNRKILKEKAKLLKSEWVAEAKEQLDKFEKIKI